MTRRFLLLTPALAAAGCGYHVAGRGDLLPRSVRTIAIPPFANNSTRYRLSDRLAQSITREFITRTRYEVIHDSNSADAVLRGSVINVQAFPLTFDTATGRASGVQMSVLLQLNLYERATGKLLFTNPNLEIRERYEISIDPVAYFEESDAAVDRLSRQVAQAVVSAILEAF